MTEKKKATPKAKKIRKKTTTKPVELTDEPTMEKSVKAVKPTTEIVETPTMEELPDVLETTPEPTFVMTKILTKDYKINFKKITTIADIVGLLKALDVTYRVDPDNITTELKTLIDTKHIKEV